MVDFSDVHRGSEPTFFFFARASRMAFEHALQECQITGWQIMTRKEALRHLPEDFVIPEVRISPNAPRVEKNVLAFISYYNLQDLSRKLQEIFYDQDIIAWANSGGERLWRACQREQKWAKDPAPFYPLAAPTAEQDKAQISGIRRGNEPTFLFFPEQYQSDLEHYLETQDVTGWEIQVCPSGLPDYLPGRFATYETAKDMAVFISYFDPEDMSRKLAEILSSEDNIEWNQKRSELAARMKQYAEKWRSDPPPFPECT